MYVEVGVILLSSALCRGTDKSSAQPGRKQARKHFRDARDFNNIETQGVNFFSLQVKAPKKIHAILIETLACFLPGRPKELSAPFCTYLGGRCFRLLHTSAPPPLARVSHLLLRFEMFRAKLNTKTWAEINICFWTQCCRNCIIKSQIINGTSKSNLVRFLFVWLDEERSMQKVDGHTRRIAGWMVGWINGWMNGWMGG